MKGETHALSSRSANLYPMQLRGPARNVKSGDQTPVVCTLSVAFRASSSAHRSGLNTCASSPKMAGDELYAAIEIKIPWPFLIAILSCVLPSGVVNGCDRGKTSSFVHMRTVLATGGSSRPTSRTTASRYGSAMRSSAPSSSSPLCSVARRRAAWISSRSLR